MNILTLLINVVSQGLVRRERDFGLQSSGSIFAKPQWSFISRDNAAVRVFESRKALDHHIWETKLETSLW